ncbi:hypothetical protein [Mesobacillus zeae]|uniref:DUF485 domain-containing protein n=1 Tax=Mesobacillus zeae TaxID=1917180 RepID=A0A398AZ37_9BACI|nr:hypothetical protein [Mesobacillus zeae]RID82314.1 hypothetical protein D1970_19270 [Mesobacillus zeae]
MAGEYSDYEYVEAGKIDVKDLPPLDSETEKIMKGEFSTGFKLSILYYLFIFTIPVLNWFAPEFMFSSMFGGMTYAWFLTGIVAMAIAFIIAYIHTNRYEKRLAKYETGHTIKPDGSVDGRSAG